MSNQTLTTKHEFWHPRLFETPYYLYLGLQCLRYGIGIRSLAKANYCLDHGEIGIGSKFQTQLAFEQQHFLPTRLLKKELNNKERISQINSFVGEHGYPIILKSDVGCVGKGIVKVNSAATLAEKAPLLIGDYILQKFTPYNLEYGIFYIRSQGVPRITGVNRKHFPTVSGNGQDSIAVLARKHPRYTEHWQTFLQYFDTRRVPTPGEEVQLSFIGSHTMGCRFTDDSHLLTPELELAVFKLFASQPGYNFGRIDVKTESEVAFRRGEFELIEINGVASLPTHMFDPRYSLRQAYAIFLQHAAMLAMIAREHRNKKMPLLPYREIIRRVKANQGMLNQVHRQLMNPAVKT